MAFKTFKPKREPVTLDALGQTAARRAEAVGGVDVPRNSGSRRTESKQALLKAIEDSGGKW